MSNLKFRSTCKVGKARGRGQALHQDRDRVRVKLCYQSKYKDHHGHDDYEKHVRRRMTAAKKECQDVDLDEKFATMDLNCHLRPLMPAP